MIESAAKSKDTKNKNIRKNQKRSIAKKLRKNKLGFIPMIAVVIIIAVLAMSLWNNWIKINKNGGEKSTLNQEYDHMRILNDALEDKVKAPVDEEYIIEIARENGFRRSDEILFYFSGGEWK